jgi:hypothetical protein
VKTIHAGSLFSLRIDILPMAFLGTAFLWVGLSAIAFYGIKIPLGEAILLAGFASLLHWISGLVHHLGHFLASKTTGYPMTGIRFGVYALLAGSRYPTDEPDLPADLHIRRALGGPILSGLLSVILLVLLPLWPGYWYWLGLFALLENSLVYTLQIFLPLGFNDSSTILRNLRGKSA